MHASDVGVRGISFVDQALRSFITHPLQGQGLRLQARTTECYVRGAAPPAIQQAPIPEATPFSSARDGRGPEQLVSV